MSNNRSLPKYDRSVAAEVVAQPDQSATMNMMINGWKQFAASANEVADKVTKDQALRQRDTLQHNISTSYRQMSQQALSNPNAQEGLNAYNEQADNYHRQLLKDTSTFNKNYVDSLSNYYGEMHRAPVFKTANNYNKRIEEADFAKYDNEKTNNINLSISNNDVGAALSLLGNQENSRRQNALITGKVDSTEKAIETSRLEFKKNRVLQEYKNELVKSPEDAANYYNNFNEKYPYELSNEQGLALAGQLDRARHQFYGAANANKNSLRTAIQNNISNSEKGVTQISPELLEKGDGILDPLVMESFRSQAQQAPLIASAVELSATSSPTVTQEKVEELRPPSVKPDGMSDTTWVGLNKSYNTAKALVLEKRKLYEDDPVDFAQKNDPNIRALAQQATVDANAGASSTSYQSTPYNLTAPNMNDALATFQIMKGTKKSDIKYLDKKTAQDLVARFETANEVEQTQMLMQLRQEHASTDEYKQVIKQLAGMGLSPALSVIGNYDPSDPELHEVLSAFKMKYNEFHRTSGETDKINKTARGYIDNIEGSSWFGDSRMKSYLKSINSTHPDDMEAFKSQTYDELKHLIAYAQSHNIKKPENWAIDRITHGMDFGNYDGVTIRAPKDTPLETVYDYATNQKANLDAFEYKPPKRFIDERIKDGKILADIQKEYYEKIVKPGHFVTNPTMTGMIWADVNGQIITDDNGHAYEFSYEEAKNWQPNSYVAKIHGLRNLPWYAKPLEPTAIYQALRAGDYITEKVKGAIQDHEMSRLENIVKNTKPDDAGSVPELLAKPSKTELPKSLTTKAPKNHDNDVKESMDFWAKSHPRGQKYIEKHGLKALLKREKEKKDKK